jgi:ABC-2 type transport system permease protein
MYPVFLREMLVFARRFKGAGHVVSAIITPLLYLLTFGLGLGRGVSMSGVSYLVFVIPGICAMSAMTNAYNGTALSISAGRNYYKSFEVFLTSPISNASIIAGEVLAGAVRGLFASCFVVIAGMFLGAHVPSSLFFYLAWVLTALVFSCMGVIAGFWVSSEDDLSQFSNFFIMPMSFFCGTFFAVDKLPPVIRSVLYCMPLTHATMVMRDGFTGKPVAWFSLMALALFLCVFFVIALYAIHRSKR